MNRGRIATMIGKELREFRANPAAVLPVLILIVICTILPFLVVTIVPRLTGESITSDKTLRQAVAVARLHLPSLAGLSEEAAAEAFLFQQFLLLFIVTPIVGAVSLAAYTVVGEKQGRTLEPLLTTPMSTSELLVAKVLASFLPSLAVEAAGVAMFLALVVALAAPGVAGSLLTVRTAVLLGVLGPFASLAALQATIAVSSRVNDPRSAQQVALLVVVPLVMLLVGQVVGGFVISSAGLLLVSIAVMAVWVLLIMVSVALFERETILTRWK